ncbi:hypothetical protein Pve01_32890 [Planomonospora venezuelensis]|nr:hypothetical protein Pve01_32890 [Planomonospora venezuelensis]
MPENQRLHQLKIRQPTADFVDAEVRRQGIATAVIEWVARDAKERGFPGLYWNTLEDAPARALYDKVGKFHKGLIHYAYRRDVNQTPTQR